MRVPDPEFRGARFQVTFRFADDEHGHRVASIHRLTACHKTDELPVPGPLLREHPPRTWAETSCAHAAMLSLLGRPRGWAATERQPTQARVMGYAVAWQLD